MGGQPNSSRLPGLISHVHRFESQQKIILPPWPPLTCRFSSNSVHCELLSLLPRLRCESNSDSYVIRGHRFLATPLEQPSCTFNPIKDMNSAEPIAGCAVEHRSQTPSLGSSTDPRTKVPFQPPPHFPVTDADVDKHVRLLKSPPILLQIPKALIMWGYLMV